MSVARFGPWGHCLLPPDFSHINKPQNKLQAMAKEPYCILSQL